MNGPVPHDLIRTSSNAEAKGQQEKPRLCRAPGSPGVAVGDGVQAEEPRTNSYHQKPDCAVPGGHLSPLQFRNFPLCDRVLGTAAEKATDS